MDLSRYQPFFGRMRECGFAQWVSALQSQTQARLRPDAHGDLPRWWSALGALPTFSDGSVRLDHACVGVAPAIEPDPAQRDELRSRLMELHPWRKGPYCLFGLHLDSEWRSDWKWDRLSGQIKPLEGRTVLDVGCGNGYHCWRMAGAGARLVLGIDPTILYVMQYLAVAGYLRDARVAVLPLALEDLPADMTGFDSLFSMGVLYHRRSPLAHLRDLHRLLRPGGELVLETLVIEEEEGGVLIPKGRYARMRNVRLIPSPRTLVRWVRRCGFREPRLVDVTSTSSKEQRSTDWMRFQSLADFLDPDAPGRTLEGHPAPRRAILVATA